MSTNFLNVFLNLKPEKRIFCAVLRKWLHGQIRVVQVKARVWPPRANIRQVSAVTHLEGQHSAGRKSGLPREREIHECVSSGVSRGCLSVNKVESNPRWPNSDLWPAHTCSRTQENSNAHTTHTYTCKEKERECFTGNYKLSVVYAPQHMMEETMLLWTHNRPVIWMQRRQKKWRISQG